jgi:ubiquinone/menaquinone biosynthesis C-methylase UbiE
LLAGLCGRVLELGCGDGRSFEHYPTAVEHVLAVEPDPTARAAAAERARDAAVRIDVVEGDAESLPAEDGSFDAAVAVWVLCSVGDPAVALRELRRVLRSGGELRFYEHVRSENAAFRVLQHTVDSLFWTRSLGGCRTTRDTVAAIRAAGFQIAELDRGFHSSSLVTITSAPYVLGTARRRRVREL